MGDAIKRVVSQLNWKGPASEREIDSARSRIGFSLPEDFLELYKHSNGLSGNLEPSGKYLIVWPIGKLLEKNAAYNVSDYAPGIFIFGSNGGGEAYGFATKWKIVQRRFLLQENLRKPDHKAVQTNVLVRSYYKKYPSARPSAI
jgi:hypothetical protein